MLSARPYLRIAYTGLAYEHLQKYWALGSQCFRALTLVALTVPREAGLRVIHLFELALHPEAGKDHWPHGQHAVSKLQRAGTWLVRPLSLTLTLILNLT